MAIQRNQSEVARLLERISDEYRAGNAALYSTAIVAPHRFISARLENMFHTQQQIALIVGDDEANHLVAATLDRIPDEDLLPHIEDSIRSHELD